MQPPNHESNLLSSLLYILHTGQTARTPSSGGSSSTPSPPLTSNQLTQYILQRLLSTASEGSAGNCFTLGPSINDVDNRRSVRLGEGGQDMAQIVFKSFMDALWSRNQKLHVRVRFQACAILRQTI